MQLPLKKNPESGEMFLEMPESLLNQVNQLAQLSETLKSFSTEAAQLRDKDEQIARLAEENAKLKSPEIQKAVLADEAGGKDAETELAKLKEENFRLIGQLSEEYRMAVLNEAAHGLTKENWEELGRRLGYLEDVAPETPMEELKEPATDMEEPKAEATEVIPANPRTVIKVGNKLYPVKEE